MRAKKWAWDTEGIPTLAAESAPGSSAGVCPQQAVTDAHLLADLSGGESGPALEGRIETSPGLALPQCLSASCVSGLPSRSAVSRHPCSVCSTTCLVACRCVLYFKLQHPKVCVH